MKIWYEFPRPALGAEGFYARLAENWKRVGRPDSELIIKAPIKGTAEFRYSIVGHMYADLLRTIEMLEGVIQAEKEGCDAAVIGCFGDPGLEVAEALVNIPVTGPAKAALIFGQSLGNRMGFVTLPHWEDKVAKVIRSYGLESLALAHKPCRALDLPLEDFKDEGRVVENFLKIAREMIGDGADVVLMACVNTSTYLTNIGMADVDGVPIVDGALAALKLAEVLAEFKKSGLWKSRKSISDDIIQGLRKGYYHGSESL